MSLAFRYASTQKWLIKEDYLQFMLEVAARVSPKLNDIEKQLGGKLENRSKPASTDGKVRVIPVIGPIVRYADMFSDISGATSLSNLKAEFNNAMEDDTVSSVLFEVDSPGGEAAGINEFAEAIFAARGKKPMISYVSNMACSAAYWIASATDEIICDDTAVLGSIGCAGVITDTSERDAKEGIKNIQFVSSNSPNKRPDVTTDEGKELIQQQIDDIGNIFITKVARNRSREDKELTVKDVIQDFNQGGVLTGKNAVKAGLADKLGSLESVLENLRSGETLSLMNKKETSMKLNDKDIKVTDNEQEVETVAANDEAAPKKDKAEVPTPQVSVKDFEKLKIAAEKTAQLNEELAAKFTALQETNFKLEQDALKIKAENFAMSIKGKVLPAQEERVIKEYIQNSNDDANNPIEGYSRVENFVEMWNAMPDHNLKKEQMEDEETVALDNGVDSDESVLLAALDAQATTLADRLNKIHASK